MTKGMELILSDTASVRQRALHVLSVWSGASKTVWLRTGRADLRPFRF
jgi:hypothetical protein